MSRETEEEYSTESLPREARQPGVNDASGIFSLTLSL